MDKPETSRGNVQRVTKPEKQWPPLPHQTNKIPAAADCTCPLFCVNCGMTEHAGSQCQNVSIQDDIAYSVWAEPPPLPQTTSDDEMVLTLRLVEMENIKTPLVVICGKTQIQTSPEPTTFDPTGKTIMSVKLALAAVRTNYPDPTLESFMRQLLDNKKNPIKNPNTTYRMANGGTANHFQCT